MGRGRGKGGGGVKESRVVLHPFHNAFLTLVYCTTFTVRVSSSHKWIIRFQGTFNSIFACSFNYHNITMCNIICLYINAFDVLPAPIPTPSPHYLIIFLCSVVIGSYHLLCKALSSYKLQGNI